MKWKVQGFAVLWGRKKRTTVVRKRREFWRRLLWPDNARRLHVIEVKVHPMPVA